MELFAQVRHLLDYERHDDILSVWVISKDIRCVCEDVLLLHLDLLGQQKLYPLDFAQVLVDSEFFNFLFGDLGLRELVSGVKVFLLYALHEGV